MKKITLMLFSVFLFAFLFGQSSSLQSQNMEEPTRSPASPSVEELDTDFSKGLTPRAEIDVAILTPDDDPHDAFINELDDFDNINASLFPQGLIADMDVDDLLEYDVLITYNNHQWSAGAANADPDHVGNVLAEYIDEGGAFIEGCFVMDFWGWEIGGTYFNENYSPWQQATGDGTHALNLDEIHEPDHPIFTDVEDFGTTSTMLLDHPGTVDGILLADYDNGWHAIAEKEDKNIIAINLLTMSGGGINYTGDGSILYKNAIVYLAEPPEPPFEVTFEVECSETGDPLEGALVTLDEEEKETNEEGIAIFEEVDEGTYDYMVEKTGYTDVEDEITVEGPKTVNVEMEPIPTYTVTFEIEDVEGNEIEEAIVTLGEVENEPGEYVFEDVEEGTHEYKVEKEAYLTVEDEITVEEDKTVEVTMEFELFTLELEANPEEGGTVEGEGEYHYGEEVTITAEAEENEQVYEFENWTGDTDYVDDPESAETTVTMPAADVSLTANFQDVTGLTELEGAELSIYPNPAKDEVSVKSNELINEIKLITLSGQVVKSIVVDSHESVINISNLQTGVYLIQIHTDKGIATDRVQIAR